MRKKRIKVELGKKMEVETEADEEFDSHIVGEILRQEFKQIRTNGLENEINDQIESEVEMDSMAIQKSKMESRRMKNGTG